MTDAVTKQLAIVAVVAPQVNAQVKQLAIVAICPETPPAAGGAKAMQMAIVTVAREFYIPPVFVPIPIGKFMATMPYYIGEFQ